MIKTLTFEETTYNKVPEKYEAGTAILAEAIGLGAAIDYLNEIGFHNAAQYEEKSTTYAVEQLSAIPSLRLIGTAPHRAGVLSFIVDGVRNEDIGDALNREGIAVRVGHHCAQPALRRYGLDSTVRPSLAFYNTFAEIDRLVSTLQRLT